MPELNGVTVRVTSASGAQILDEYGVQHLRQAKKVSAYIQANTDEAFEVSIEPRFPWRERRGSNMSREPPSCNGPNCHPVDLETRRTSSIGSCHSPSHEAPSSVPEYSLLVKVHLDGREKAERRSLVHLNLHDHDFSSRGKVLKNSWIDNGDGSLTEHSWVFKERGIESVLSKLNLTAITSDELDEDALSHTLASADISSTDVNTLQQTLKAGQIVITFNKVRLGLPYLEQLRNSNKGNAKEDDEMHDTDGQVTHTAQRVSKHNKFYGPRRCHAISAYEGDEEPFATFIFFYRSRETLAKMGFLDFQHDPRSTGRSKRTLRPKMATLTPLSVLESSSLGKEKSLISTPSYEDKVKTNSFETHKPLCFDSELNYREPGSPLGRLEHKSCKALTILPSIEDDGDQVLTLEKNVNAVEDPRTNVAGLGAHGERRLRKMESMNSRGREEGATLAENGGHGTSSLRLRSRGDLKSSNTFKSLDRRHSDRHGAQQDCIVAQSRDEVSTSHAEKGERIQILGLMISERKAEHASWQTTNKGDQRSKLQGRKDDAEANAKQTLGYQDASGQTMSHVAPDLQKTEKQNIQGLRKSARLQERGNQIHVVGQTSDSATQQPISITKAPSFSGEGFESSTVHAQDLRDLQHQTKMDGEESADDIATESELDFNSDTDRDEGPYNLNHEGESETFVGLRTKLGNIEIKKRARGEGGDPDDSDHHVGVAVANKRRQRDSS